MQVELGEGLKANKIDVTLSDPQGFEDRLMERVKEALKSIMS